MALKKLLVDMWPAGQNSARGQIQKILKSLTSDQMLIKFRLIPLFMGEEFISEIISLFIGDADDIFPVWRQL